MKTKVEIGESDWGNLITQYVYVHANDGRIHSVPADDETLRQIADAIKAHFGEEAAEGQSREEIAFSLINHAARTCFTCEGRSYIGDEVPGWCPECKGYMKFIREVENG